MQHAVLLRPGHCNGVASIQEWFSSAVKHRWPVIASDLSDLAPWILITLLLTARWEQILVCWLWWYCRHIMLQIFVKPYTYKSTNLIAEAWSNKRHSLDYLHTTCLYRRNTKHCYEHIRKKWAKTLWTSIERQQLTCNQIVFSVI